MESWFYFSQLPRQHLNEFKKIVYELSELHNENVQNTALIEYFDRNSLFQLKRLLIKKYQKIEKKIEKKVRRSCKLSEQRIKTHKKSMYVLSRHQRILKKWAKTRGFGV